MVVKKATPVNETVTPPATLKSEAHVVIGGQINRTYSRDIHGDTFVDLAHEFAKQHPGAEVSVR